MATLPQRTRSDLGQRCARMWWRPPRGLAPAPLRCVAEIQARSVLALARLDGYGGRFQTCDPIVPKCSRR